MSVALINFMRYRDEVIQEPDLFKIILSIHDAVLLLCKATDAERVMNEVFPICMTHGVTVPGTGLNYTLGDFDISTRWGATTPPEELESIGLPKHLCGYKE